MARDWEKPYKTEGDEMVRQIVAEVARQAGPDDQIVVLESNDSIWVGATFEWYLRRQGERVQWNGMADWTHLQQHGDLWVFSFDRDGSGRAAFETRLLRFERPMLLIAHQTHNLQLGQSDETLAHCEILRWRGMYEE